MSVQTTTHLNFRGQAREALGFYRSVFGGEQTVVTYGELAGETDAARRDEVIWGQVVSRDGFCVMAYDVQPEKAWHPGENAFYVSLRGTAPEEIEAYWTRLSEGAAVVVPLGPAVWSPLYGMLTDRFGITWVLDVATVRPEA
jgi:PhnB protein